MKISYFSLLWEFCSILLRIGALQGHTKTKATGPEVLLVYCWTDSRSNVSRIKWKNNWAYLFKEFWYFKKQMYMFSNLPKVVRCRYYFNDQRVNRLVLFNFVIGKYCLGTQDSWALSGESYSTYRCVLLLYLLLAVSSS